MRHSALGARPPSPLFFHQPPEELLGYVSIRGRGFSAGKRNAAAAACGVTAAAPLLEGLCRDLWVLKAYSTSSSLLLLASFFLPLAFPTLLMVGFWGCFSWRGGGNGRKLRFGGKWEWIECSLT